MRTAICPKCNYTWFYRGKGERIQCPKCKKFFRVSYKKTAGKPADKEIVKNIMSGDILKAMKQVGIDPSQNIGDAIPMVIQNPELELRLARASKKYHRSPEKIIQMAVDDWLNKREKNVNP